MRAPARFYTPILQAPYARNSAAGLFPLCTVQAQEVVSNGTPPTIYYTLRDNVKVYLKENKKPLGGLMWPSKLNPLMYGLNYKTTSPTKGQVVMPTIYNLPLSED